MNFLRQSTAVDVALGPFIDDDGITPATGLTITQAETRLKKNNGAWAQANDATSATHEEEGWYEKELDATDTNTVGILIVAVYISGSLASWKEYQVVEEAVYDAFFAASALGYVANAPVNVAQWLGSAAATPTVAGVPEVDITHWLGTAAATPTVGGVPEVDVTHWIGTAAATPTTAGVPEVDVTFWAGSAVTIEYLGIDAVGTLSGTHSATTADLGANAPSTDTLVGHTLHFPAHNLSVLITAYNEGTGVATFADITATGITLVDTNVWILFASAAAAAGAGGGATAQEVWEYADRQLTALDEDVTTIDLNATTIGTATNVTTVNGLAANVITATSINADAFTAAKFAADVTTELQSGLATSAAVATLQTSVDDLPTNAELATSQAAADDATLAAIAALNNISAAAVNAEVDTAIADAFNFTAGSVDANITHVIADPVQEAGASDTNWGGAP